MFLKVSPTRGVVRFGKKGKLNPRFIGPFEVIQRVDECAYHLALPPSLSRVHDVFHVSMLKKYIIDPSHMLDHLRLQFDDHLTLEEHLVRIMD